MPYSPTNFWTNTAPSTPPSTPHYSKQEVLEFIHHLVRLMSGEKALSFHNKVLSLLSDRGRAPVAQGLPSSVWCSDIVSLFLAILPSSSKIQDFAFRFRKLLLNRIHSVIQQTFIEQVYMLTVIYKRAHIRFMIFKCGIYFVYFIFWIRFCFRCWPCARSFC